MLLQALHTAHRDMLRGSVRTTVVSGDGWWVPDKEAMRARSQSVAQSAATGTISRRFGAGGKTRFEYPLSPLPKLGQNTSPRLRSRRRVSASTCWLHERRFRWSHFHGAPLHACMYVQPPPYRPSWFAARFEKTCPRETRGAGALGERHAASQLCAMSNDAARQE